MEADSATPCYWDRGPHNSTKLGHDQPFHETHALRYEQDICDLHQNPKIPLQEQVSALMPEPSPDFDRSRRHNPPLRTLSKTTEVALLEVAHQLRRTPTEAGLQRAWKAGLCDPKAAITRTQCKLPNVLATRNGGAFLHRSAGNRPFRKKASYARCNPFANPPKRTDVRTARQTLDGLGQRYPATQGPKSLSTNGGANRFERWLTTEVVSRGNARWYVPKHISYGTLSWAFFPL